MRVQLVVDSLQAAALAERHRENTTGQMEAEDWRNVPLTDVIAHINNTHHKYVKERIIRVAPLFEKVCSVHASKHPELLQLREEFHALSQELLVHMMKEERVLFPYIERMEESVVAGEPVLPAPFGTVSNPLATMVHEHDSAGNLLRNIRKLSGDCMPPEGACMSYKTLYSTLAEFERDLHEHIHLENNVLFPRAIEMEQGARYREQTLRS